MHINVEYRHKNGFEDFLRKAASLHILLMYDVNTAPYALAFRDRLQEAGCRVSDVLYPDAELIPTEAHCERAFGAAEKADYVLAVGSGTLNDMAKSISTRRGIPCGVLATAASMDGYCSAGAALMRGGVKVTDVVHPPQDVLVDLDIIRRAPRALTAAGFGDIIGKFTCLADWQLSHLVRGEPIHREAYAMMEQARTACMAAYQGLIQYREDAVEALMDALITAGLSMAMCGNSRPASGSEHHQSHYLEMDFVRRGERIPLHGVKVGIGTLVSLALYRYIAQHRISCPNASHVWELAESLPDEERIREMLCGMGCPIRFSEIGVREQTMRDMLRDAHTVRDRYTVLTLVHELGLTHQVTPMIMEKYF